MLGPGDVLAVWKPDRLGRSLGQLIVMIDGIDKAVGRPRKLSAHQITRARALIEAGEETRSGVAELFGVDVATLRRALGKKST